MPPVHNRRTGATNTRSGRQVRPAWRTVLARTPAPAPVVEAVIVALMEEEDIPNAGALHALKPVDNLDQVPALFFKLV